MNIKDERTLSQLVHLTAQFIAKEAGRTTLITPTRAELGRTREYATVYVSIFPEKDARNALQFLERNEKEFRAFLRKETRFSVIPHIRFAQDLGERNYERLEELSKDV